MSDDIDFRARRRVRPAPGGFGILVAHLGAAPKPYVYVGRAMKGIPASPLGNPYRGDGAIAQFRLWLRGAYKADRDGAASQEQHAAAQELRRLVEIYRETGALTLACWCATGPNPEDGPCHADVIAVAVVGLVAAEPLAIHVPGVGDCCARWDADMAAEGLPWDVTHDGRVIRAARSLAHARAPRATRVVPLGPGASAQLAAMGYGKCDSCGQVKPGIGHKEICVECLTAALPGRAA